ncbi:hypothetical protein P5V15_001315 [Pogonomyrmex californicus]
MILGIRKDIAEQEEKRGREMEEIIMGKIKNSWRVVEVYIKGDMERKLEELADWVEGRRDGMRTIIRGDFNARTGEEGGRRGSEEEEEEGRRSKDKKMNKEGRMDRGWLIE